MSRMLTPEPLTQAAFAPFGDVIETEGAEARRINAGFATRFHDLTRIDVGREGGRPILSIFEARPRPTPLVVPLLERHPLGSQSFFPLESRAWLAVVAPDADGAPDLDAARCFRARGDQGLTYAPGAWHAPLLVTGAGPQRFLVVDRLGALADLSDNLEEAPLAGESVLTLAV